MSKFHTSRSKAATHAMQSQANRTMGRRLSRRGVLKGAAVAGAAAAASSVYSAPAVIGQERAPVVFWTTHSDLGFDALTQITENFNAQSETAEVEIVQRPPADVTDSSSLITAVRGGEGPDVYLLDRFIVAERGATGLLENLTPLMENSDFNPDLEETYVGFAAAEARFDGEPYALPFDSDVRGLFYNRTLIEESGVDLELFEPENGPMTFDQLKEAAMEINVIGDNNQLSQAGFVPYFSQGHSYTYGFSWGADFFDYENCEVSPDTEEMLAASQWLYDFSADVDAQTLYSFIQGATVPGASPTDNPFIQGRLASYIVGNWEPRIHAQYAEDLDIGVTYTPVPEEGMDSVTWAGGWSGVIPTGAQEPEAAFEFLQYLCGEDAQLLYYEVNGNLPSILSLQEDPEVFADNEQMQFFVEELLPTALNRPPLPVGARYWDELEDAWERIYLNEQEPGPALEQVKNNTQPDLDAGGYCPIEQS